MGKKMISGICGNQSTDMIIRTIFYGHIKENQDKILTKAVLKTGNAHNIFKQIVRRITTNNEFPKIEIGKNLGFHIKIQ